MQRRSVTVQVDEWSLTTRLVLFLLPFDCLTFRVRVPFNAIVLGVEQLRDDLYSEPLRPVDEMQDVVNILNEQSKVVARILNDVLSLQKIEDGALQLEMSPFSMIEMICGTLRSFQPLLAEKNLILMT